MTFHVSSEQCFLGEGSNQGFSPPELGFRSLQEAKQIKAGQLEKCCPGFLITNSKSEGVSESVSAHVLLSAAQSNHSTQLCDSSNSPLTYTAAN